jgi:mannose-6-phosphate isomerase-like protein (cupin superfamily)
MTFIKDEKDVSSRRDFFQDVSSGVGGAAIIAAALSMGVPILNAAQGGEAKPEAKPDAKPKAKQAASGLFRNPPPWPKGAEPNKYKHLWSTRLRETSSTDVVPGPQAYFRGESDLPGAKINMGWQILVKPYKMELESHHHDVDEYLFFMGATFPDLCGSFDAEIEFFVGPEYERYIITQACVLYVPAGLEHNPSDFRRIGKPLFFSALQLAPYFNSVYQTMGYMGFRGMGNKIDKDGKPLPPLMDASGRLL